MPNIISYEFAIVDGKKAKSSITLYMYDLGVLTTEEMNAIAVTALPVLRNIIVGGILSCRIGFQADLADLLEEFPSLSTPESYADVEEGGLFEWDVQAEAQTTKQRIPTFDESLLIPGTREIDQEDLRTVAFVEMMTQFIETPIDTYNFTNSKGHQLDFLHNGKERFKRRKKTRPRRR